MSAIVSILGVLDIRSALEHEDFVSIEYPNAIILYSVIGAHKPIGPGGIVREILTDGEIFWLVQTKIVVGGHITTTYFKADHEGRMICEQERSAILYEIKKFCTEVVS